MPMMDVQLNGWLLFSHAEPHHAGVEIVSRFPTGEIHRYTYRDMARRAQQLMHALDSLGIERGARVATLAWNHHRHLECYFGIPLSNRVLHTLNVRLAPSELAFIIRDAEDTVILADPDQMQLLRQVDAEGGLAGVRHIVVLADELPKGAPAGAIAYEPWIAAQNEVYAPIDIDERSPFGMCYTSGTTGRSKGVVYTHRSVFLHSMAVCTAAGMNVGPADAAMPVVPMFHAMAWGLPHAAVATGAKLVFCAGPLDNEALADLLENERVTVTAGVPTVWLGLADELDRRGRAPSALQRIAVGGAQPPRPLIERYLHSYGIPILQAWGMTETSPLASIALPRHGWHDLPEEEVTARARCQAGLPMFGLDIAVRDADGNEVAADGETMGDLYVRGPWVAASYWRGVGPEQFDGGWFRTGDVAIKSPDGYFVIADRTKDLIKSGGEWISSVDMEGHIMAMPQVAEAAVVAIPDNKWQERPLACIVLKPGETLTLEQVRAHLEGRGWARWQLPDRIEVIDEVPRTSVGKFDKKVLRARFAPQPAAT
ncbi:MAG: long-chain fatty acid--CoA ligase [Candidatus Dormibacteraeota bacterium]|nr:long-chain fatty acid--CoA ligase [Candidatus Dormibacteraeota bacterium]